jgi:hypothetical protein
MKPTPRNLRRLALAVALLACLPVLAGPLTLKFHTGGDDLRGGNDNLTVRLLGVDGRVLTERANVNQGRGWGGGSVNSVVLNLTSAQTGQLAAVELETIFGGGIGGDNWNLDRLQLVGNSASINDLDLRGAPLFRFTGEQRVRRFKLDLDRCRSNADCDDGLAANGAEACVSVPIAGTMAKQCKAGLAPACASGMVFSEASDACERGRTDADGDGVDSVASGGTDCDDNDNRRFPGNIEVCDAHGADEDCDFQTGGERDADGDGEISSECFNWGPPPR